MSTMETGSAQETIIETKSVKAQSIETQSVDYLVLGSGVAGLRAALELSRHGTVYVITKDELKESSTEYAQGGVAVALSDEDTIGIHLEDTLKAGDGLCNEDAVRVLVNEGPERIMELISWGAEFDKSGTKLSFTLEAAHSRHRILHSHGDSTGKEIERVLLNKVRSSPDVKKYSFAYVIDLIVKDGRCYGAYVIRENHVIAILARATVLATGGAGQVYSRTTNPTVATGDGIALAFRAGATIEDVEMVQFHPTSLFAPSAPQFLLSEALRGEGAKLKNIHKEEFLKLYHPRGELAPRDIVSRSIVTEMARTNSRHVYLDIRHLDCEFIKSRFPMIYRTCLKYDIDITSELVPVSPAAHYMMGGVKTNIDGATNLRCLYAAGEVACTGVHGANRLASNSLLEGLVFGARAGKSAALDKDPGTIAIGDLRVPAFLNSIEYPDEIRMALRKTMWNQTGIIRNCKAMNEALETIGKWKDLTEGPYPTRYENEIRNMVQTSILITSAALMRQSSAGAHFRDDFPHRSKPFHITISRDDEYDMGMKFTMQPDG